MTDILKLPLRAMHDDLGIVDAAGAEIAWSRGIRPLAMREIVRRVNAHDELVAALRNLVAACDYVAPFAGAVATAPTVQHFREAGHFVQVVERANALLQRIGEPG